MSIWTRCGTAGRSAKSILIRAPQHPLPTNKL